MPPPAKQAGCAQPLPALNSRTHSGENSLRQHFFRRLCRGVSTARPSVSRLQIFSRRSAQHDSKETVYQVPKKSSQMISASQYPAVRDTLCFFLPTGINSFLFPHLFSTNFHRELRFSTVIPQLNFPGSCARSFAQAQSYQQRVWRSGALDCSWRSFRVAKPAESWNPG